MEDDEIIGLKPHEKEAQGKEEEETSTPSPPGVVSIDLGEHISELRVSREERELRSSEPRPIPEPESIFLGYGKKRFLPFRSRTILGVDLGMHTLKAVELQKAWGGVNLVSLGVIELSPQDMPSDGSSNLARVAALKRFLGGMAERTPIVVTSLGGSSVVVRQIQLPLIPRGKFFSTIQWEARRYIPFEKEEMVIDAQIMDTDKHKKRMDVMVVAVSHALMEAHLGLLSQAGVEPRVVDNHSLALMNSLFRDSYLRGDETVVMLDIGASTTTLNIFRVGGAYLTRCISIAGNRFTMEIQKRLGLDYAQAEAMKREKEEVSEIVKPAVDSLVSELRQSLIYYKNQTGKGEFDRIILCGGSARLSNLNTYLAQELGIPVEIYDPLRKISLDPRVFPRASLQGLAPQLTLALSLALRGC